MNVCSLYARHSHRRIGVSSAYCCLISDIESVVCSGCGDFVQRVDCRIGSCGADYAVDSTVAGGGDVVDTCSEVTN